MDVSNSEAEWIEKEIAEFIEAYGAVPPPWFMFPDTHPYDIGWRMGAGESHVMVFSTWWEQKKNDFDEAQRIEYFRRWPPPPRWLPWMIDVIWDLDPLEMEDPEAFNYSPYFARTEALGFGTQAEYEQDINDPRWLED
jgi:hypothetical protein